MIAYAILSRRSARSSWLYQVLPLTRDGPDDAARLAAELLARIQASSGESAQVIVLRAVGTRLADAAAAELHRRRGEPRVLLEAAGYGAAVDVIPWRGKALTSL
jgi:hypothetical protein